jgi:phosphate-selective porin OprO and OprP
MMKRQWSIHVLAVALAAALAVPGSDAGGQAPPASEKSKPARVDSAAGTVRSMTDRIEELDQKIKVLERLRELDQEAAEARARVTPTLVAGTGGFSMRSADGNFQMRFRGYTQFDGRYFNNDVANSFTNTFVMRRVRPIFEGTLYKYIDFRVMPDFGGGAATLFDAHVDIRFHPLFAIRGGKYKPPVGLERLQSAADLLFVERGLPTNLVPSRDIGIQVSGETKNGVLAYQAGVFNGAVDLANGEADNGNGKDGAARVMLTPFRNVTGPLSGLTFGVAGTRGIHRGTSASPFVAGYRSPLQATVFSYRSDVARGAVIASGTHTRLSPQGYFYVGPVGLLGEYVASEQEVRRDSTGATLNHRAWQLAGNWMLTGEPTSFRGITPKKPFDPTKGQWGAFELGARIGGLTLDDKTFPYFADSTRAVREAQSVGVAFNWYLVRGVRIQLNYETTDFTGGATAGNRPTENAFFTRFQFSF